MDALHIQHHHSTMNEISIGQPLDTNKTIDWLIIEICVCYRLLHFSVYSAVIFKYTTFEHCASMQITWMELFDLQKGVLFLQRMVKQILFSQWFCSYFVLQWYSIESNISFSVPLNRFIGVGWESLHRMKMKNKPEWEIKVMWCSTNGIYAISSFMNTKKLRIQSKYLLNTWHLRWNCSGWLTKYDDFYTLYTTNKVCLEICLYASQYNWNSRIQMRTAES